ncbi:unnamed protein product, partial [marine sediment metagenome]
SFLDWGVDVTSNPQKGDVVVLSTTAGPSKGHVGFFMGYNEDGSIQVLGGNTSNGVNEARFASQNILGFRRSVSQASDTDILQARESLLNIEDSEKREAALKYFDDRSQTRRALDVATDTEEGRAYANDMIEGIDVNNDVDVLAARQELLNIDDVEKRESSVNEFDLQIENAQKLQGASDTEKGRTSAENMLKGVDVNDDVDVLAARQELLQIKDVDERASAVNEFDLQVENKRKLLNASDTEEGRKIGLQAGERADDELSAIRE